MCGISFLGEIFSAKAMVSHYKFMKFKGVRQMFPYYISMLVGGLEHFLFSDILGIIIPIDFHIFQRASNHQPDSLCRLQPIVVLRSANSRPFSVVIQVHEDVFLQMTIAHWPCCRSNLTVPAGPKPKYQQMFIDNWACVMKRWNSIRMFIIMLPKVYHSDCSAAWLRSCTFLTRRF